MSYFRTGLEDPQDSLLGSIGNEGRKKTKDFFNTQVLCVHCTAFAHRLRPLVAQRLKREERGERKGRNEGRNQRENSAFSDRPKSSKAM